MCFGGKGRFCLGHVKFELLAGLSQKTGGWLCSSLTHFTAPSYKSGVASEARIGPICKQYTGHNQGVRNEVKTQVRLTSLSHLFDLH